MESEQPRYGKCKKCGAEAVHLATSGGIAFFGDQDDDRSDKSAYADEPIEPTQDVTVGVHICFECGELEDVWIEEPHELDATEVANRQQWRTYAGMIEPIASSDYCLCTDPPRYDHEEEGQRDPDNPSCHSQYCPVYLYAYALAMAEEKELPE